ncbi:MAG: thioredoxin domain-containing protein [Oscillospiraceae bacterium]|nr:thioredoxin domain-containing protein [Oscillospiraceae bacterium]MDY6208601.1 thioredoxin domain-containing protein [Oscillospiraceae bacterium]
MAVRVSTDTFDEEVLNAGGAVIADFYSDSCVPCKRLSPVLAEIEEEQGDKVKFVKININFDPELAEKYGVMSVPTLVFFGDGEEISRLTGAVKKSEIVSEIEKI